MHKRNLMPYEIYLGQSPSIDRLFVRFLQTAQQLVTSAHLYSGAIYNSVKPVSVLAAFEGHFTLPNS